MKYLIRTMYNFLPLLSSDQIWRSDTLRWKCLLGVSLWTISPSVSPFSPSDKSSDISSVASRRPCSLSHLLFAIRCRSSHSSYCEFQVSKWFVNCRITLDFHYKKLQSTRVIYIVNEITKYMLAKEAYRRLNKVKVDYQTLDSNHISFMALFIPPTQWPRKLTN